MSLQTMRRANVPLHVEVASLLRSRILSGDLKSGERLPSLAELAKVFGVTSLTVRQAMNTLDDEGLIERASGRGTFVKEVEIKPRRVFSVKSDLSQLLGGDMPLEVVLSTDTSFDEDVVIDGVAFKRLKRRHELGGQPFCMLDVHLRKDIYQDAPEKFDRELIVSAFKELGIALGSATQTVALASADLEMAEGLQVEVNSPVFKVVRKVKDDADRLIYFGDLIYPGDALEFRIDFLA
ncbi:MAG: GntR family transcriptional regulator [Marinovum algicola]|jgi:GntR family transcriptional regulator|uniref:Transcriptional regulator, GntR family n=1 Tax=Marinovum algicola TaxID=42444 RepID=A0A975ZM44_9RHOB|nr:MULTISPECIES: GntR family transcriptional regulator [Marinovum]AKO96161.1 Transcriptional regulator [Marinovum algicola DG 898]MDD9740120.1 GntR family transcriptional regulator [Marinovum sp. SP66]MDD9742934.1 GntR family transcriptional regulator [Marinovum sp. PR37]SEI66536.1 transcriptional regulator, GntR family [Marinovum algicola]SLN23799.1 HTH-type transcriptional repressor YvoA [Marinovum algicola]